MTVDATEVEARRASCREVIDLTPMAQQAIKSIENILTKSPAWPHQGWYSDRDFCRAYNTAVKLQDTIEGMLAKPARVRRRPFACLTHLVGTLGFLSFTFVVLSVVMYFAGRVDASLWVLLAANAVSIQALGLRSKAKV